MFGLLVRIVVLMKLGSQMLSLSRLWLALALMMLAGLRIALQRRFQPVPDVRSLEGQCFLHGVHPTGAAVFNIPKGPSTQLCGIYPKPTIPNTETLADTLYLGT